MNFLLCNLNRRFIVFWVILFCSAYINLLSAQRLFQFYYNIMNPMMMDAESYPGHSFGFNILNGKFGYELDYARTGKRFDNRYFYINPQFKILFNKKEKSQISTYRYATVGFYRFTAIKNGTYSGRGDKLQSPYWDTMENAKTYNEYNVMAKMKTSFMQMGYESVKEKHIKGVAFSKMPILNPFGMIIGWISSEKGEPYKLDYTRTFRFSIFATAPNFIELEQTGYEPLGGEYLKNEMPKENIIIEPLMKNLVGCRLGVLWTSLKPYGTTLGFEISMVPGIYNIPGVYGRNFPDDNIFIKANFGMSLANSSKN
ncbi:MAG: hypothetical protein IT243_08960 [Bacteroidia bacterium]|nr:hypothetical protein [Bacteroidia bacterium]